MSKPRSLFNKDNLLPVIATFFLVFCSVLLFTNISNSELSDIRSYRQAWNLGHFLLFFCLTYLIIQKWHWLTTRPFSQQLIIILFLSLIIAVSTELAQLFANRLFEANDIIKDITGSLIAVIFFSPARRTIKNSYLIYLRDDYNATADFPILADFEKPLELTRWVSGEKISLDKDFVTSGEKSLKVELSTDTYSGVGLLPYPSDWHDYNFLQINIYSVSTKPLQIHIRINDALHSLKKMPLSDLFDTQIVINHGWNELKIAIDEIKLAPRSRHMNLSRIQRIGIFVMNEKDPQVVYIDNLRLGN